MNSDQFKKYPFYAVLFHPEKPLIDKRRVNKSISNKKENNSDKSKNEKVLDKDIYNLNIDDEIIVYEGIKYKHKTLTSNTTKHMRWIIWFTIFK